MADVRYRAGPPHAVVSLQQLLVDEISAQRREVWMVPGDDPVDLALGVSPPGLKLLYEPTQHNQPLLALDRNRGQATLIDEMLEHWLVVSMH